MDTSGGLYELSMGPKLISKDIEFFSTLEFSAPYIKDSFYKAIPFMTRYDRTGSNLFFSKTINTISTISRILALVQKRVLESPENFQSFRPEFPLYISLVQVGPDLSGFLDTAHGGALASLLDETIGLCAETYRQFTSNSTKSRLYTASLEISYRAPVSIPGAIMIKVWVKKNEGRKFFLEAQILGEDNTIKAEAKSLYISVSATL